MGDDATIGHGMWVMFELAFAAINIIFAFYFQHKVWNHILERKDEFMNEVPQEQGGMAAQLRGGVTQLRGQLGGGGAGNSDTEKPKKPSNKIKVKPEHVQDSFKQVFLQDFG